MEEKARLFKVYKEKIAPSLKQKHNFKNDMEVPILKKIVLNMGVGEATQNSAVLEEAAVNLSAVAGQKAVITRAKRAISNFKLRAGMPVGCSVTLRGKRMWEFFDRLVNVAIPRVRDFRGLSPRSFDGHGNYSLGIKEQIIFREIDRDKIKTIRGMDITFVTSVDDDKLSYSLFEELGMPFRKQN
jgi:large subunit ribosomal protein L5